MQAEGPEKPDRSRRLLVVDDQEDNRAILSRRMARLGHSVTVATNGAEALSEIEREVPDLILLDYMMPGMSGMEVLRHLRLRFDRAQLPIIMVTARSEEQVVADSLAAGANDYISKPISFPVLNARVEAQLERRDATTALKELNDKLERRVAEKTKDLIAHNKALSEAHDTLEKSDRVKSLFLATMSHEMRTPLNSIIGLSEIIRNEVHGPLPAPEYKNYINEIRKSGGYLLELVTDIMNSFTMCPGPDGSEADEFDVLTALDEAITMIESSSPEQPSRIEFEDHGLALPICGDQSRLRRAFINILGNALKFSDPSDMVQIRCRRLENGFEIDVLDRGPGIPDDKLEDVMLPFIQIYNRGEVKQQGVGLGLSIAQDIVRMHGGKIKIRNRAEGGLCVTVCLPGPSLQSEVVAN